MSGMSWLKGILGIARAPTDESPPAREARVPDRLALSPNQQRLWFCQRSGASYTVSCAYRITGPLNLRALRAAVRLLVMRHESLRTALVDSGGDIVGTTLEFGTGELVEVDLRSLGPDARQHQLEGAIRQVAARPFQFDGSELLRVVVYRLQEREVGLHLTIHHIICDQWSLQILGNELFAAYRALCRGETVALAPVRHLVPIAAGAEGSTEADRSFWMLTLAGAPARVDLPYDGPPDAIARWRGERHYISYGDLGEALQFFAAQHECTVFTVLLAAFVIVYSRWLDRSDVCLGMRVAGRTAPETANAVGFFVNLLPLRFQVNEDLRLKDWITTVQEAVLNGLEHQATPFETLLNWLKCERDPLLSSLIPVTVTYQNVPTARLPELEGVSIEPLKHHNGTVKCELDLAFEGEGKTLELAVEHRSDLFRWTTVAGLVNEHRAVLAALLACADDELSFRLSSLIGEQAADVGTSAGVSHRPLTAGIDAELRHRAQLSPGAPAVLDELGVLTFGELEYSSRNMAEALVNSGRAHARVAICIRPSRQWLIAALGCLRAGVPYVAIDVAHTDSYASELLRLAGATLVVCNEDSIPPFRDESLITVPLEELCRPSFSARGRLPVISTDSQRVAYLLFTSGSTGKPKGVCIEHRQLLNCLDSLRQALPLRADDVIGQQTPVSFAPAAKEWLAGILAGRPVAVIPPDRSVRAQDLHAYVQRFGVTRLNMVPSKLRDLVHFKHTYPDSFRSLRMVVVAGEPLLAGLASEFTRQFPGVRLLNNYGCTELNDICYFEVSTTMPAGNRIPAGVPIANTTVHILDSRLEPVPRGRVGAIHVSGPGVGQGYLGAAHTTASSFVPDPYATLPGQRMFRTGDFGKLLPDGSLEYQGRRDQQVKVNGCRVDFAQITAVLLSHPAVREAAVHTSAGIQGEYVLVAYVVPQLDVAAQSMLRRHLAERLPRYMVPGCVIALPRLPTLPNGKLDRSGLTPPDWQQLADAAGFVAPRTSTEQVLAEIWKEVLERDSVSIHDNFFDCGGHSVLGIRVLARVQDVLEVELLPKTLFEAPTIAELAERIDTIRGLMTHAPDEVDSARNGAVQLGETGVL